MNKDKCAMECKVCWWVYDPDAGDSLSQIPAGTAFTDLPEYWCCQVCQTTKEGVLKLDSKE